MLSDYSNKETAVAWVEVNGIDIHYSEAGSGQPLLFLHGSGSCAENWHRQLAEFKSDHRVITYSSVNHGHSSNSPRNEPEPDRADELEGVIANLGIERPIISGHSMGGATVVRWACRHPSEARALIVSGMGIARDGSGTPRPVKQIEMEQIFIPANDGVFTEELFRTNPREAERYMRLKSTATRIEAQRHPREASYANPSRDPSELAKLARGIRSPMLIVVGSLDVQLEPAKHLHELVPNSRLAVMEGYAHNAYYQDWAGFNRIVREFIASLS